MRDGSVPGPNKSDGLRLGDSWTWDGGLMGGVQEGSLDTCSVGVKECSEMAGMARPLHNGRVDEEQVNRC